MAAALVCALAAISVGISALAQNTADPFVVAREAYDRGNFGTAREHFRTLADLGQAKAQTMMGHIYLAPRAVPQDLLVADTWYARAAAQGEPNAQLAHANLGLMHKFMAPGQQLTPLEPAVALDLLRSAAAKGLTEAMVTLANVLADPKYSIGVRGTTIWLRDKDIPKDDAEALKWLHKAAGQGDVAAQEMLGYRYLEGNGIAKDNAEAYFWLSIAVACRTTPPGVTEWVAKPLAEFLNALPKSRDQARRRLSRQQVREVDERLRKWRPTPEPDFGTALETAAERAQAKAAGPLCEPVVR